MTCQLIGQPVHTEQVELSEAEIYRQDGTYYLFNSFVDCLEEIKCLKELASEIGIA